MGVTLTLDRTRASLLIAFTAFFIGIVASCFWRILVFFIHRLYSTPNPRDALHHQRQVLLRNSVTAPSSLLAFSQLFWTWRREEGTVWRTLPVIVCAVASIVIFTVASGFSSQISSAVGNAALLDGSRCGIIAGAAQAGRLEDLGVLLPYGIRRITDSANYAQQCYGAPGAGLLDCATFIKRSLPYSTDDQAPCPFQGGICRTNTSNLLFDTGYLNSHEHLGVNSSPDRRILFKTTLHCAPLQTAGYSRDIQTPFRNYTRYYYGRRTHDTSRDHDGNYTLQVRDLDDQYDHFKHGFDNMDGHWSPTLQSYVAFVKNGRLLPTGSEFVPIPQLSRSDGDLMIFFLSGNGAVFMRPTPDPWYRGTVPGQNVSMDHSSDSLSFQTFEPEEAASPMACLQRHQFCDGYGHCGPLASYLDALAGASSVFNSTVLQSPQDDEEPATPFATFRRALGSALGTIDLMVSSFQGNALLSQQVSSSGLRGPLPDNQWQLDVTYWWTTMLAAIQASFVQMAAGTTDAELEPYVMHLNSSYVCNNQKILASAFTSFSVFGLYFVYIFGFVIIIVSVALEPLLNFLRERRDPKLYTHLERQSDQVLQLQRAAYQGIGSGTWLGFAGAVPRTERVEALADLSGHYQEAGHGEKTDGVAEECPVLSASTNTEGEDGRQFRANGFDERREEESGSSSSMKTVAVPPTISRRHSTS